MLAWACVSLASACAEEGPAAPVGPTDLDGRPVDPFAEGGTVALVFTATECPISNRAAPELRRVHDEFAGESATFWLVYPSALDEPAEIRKHIREHGYSMEALRDPGLSLVRRTGVRVTPEAAVVDANGALAYRGRIDDRFVDFGVARPEPTRRDLAEALREVASGQPVTSPRTVGVGCAIRGATQ